MPDKSTGKDPAITLTARIVAAYVVKHTVPATHLPDLISQTWSALGSLGRTAPATVEPEKPIPAVPIRKSIQPDYLISLEDGKPYKALKRHLMNRYGMTPDAYRVKWGLPKDYPMVSPSYSAKRSEISKDAGLGIRGSRTRAKPDQEV